MAAFGIRRAFPSICKRIFATVGRRHRPGVLQLFFPSQHPGKNPTCASRWPIPLNQTRQTARHVNRTSEADLDEALRQSGIERVEDARKLTLAPSGKISVLKKNLMPLNAIKTFTIGPATGREGIAGLEIAVAGIESAAR